LQKLLKGELATRRRKNVVQARSFAEMLEQTIRRYQDRAIEAAQVIEELIQLAKDMREANARGEKLGLSEDELAFYDALETNDSAVKVLGDETLRTIAKEPVETVRSNVTIDWTLRENVRAQLRVLVKRSLRKHGYPPDKQEKATQTVLEQAALLSGEWAAACRLTGSAGATRAPSRWSSARAPGAPAGAGAGWCARRTGGRRGPGSGARGGGSVCWAWRSSATWKATRGLTRRWAIHWARSRPTTRKARRSRSNSYQTGAT